MLPYFHWTYNVIFFFLLVLVRYNWQNFYILKVWWFDIPIHCERIATIVLINIHHLTYLPFFLTVFLCWFSCCYYMEGRILGTSDCHFHWHHPIYLVLCLLSCCMFSIFVSRILCFISSSAFIWINHNFYYIFLSINFLGFFFYYFRGYLRDYNIHIAKYTLLSLPIFLYCEDLKLLNAFSPLCCVVVIMHFNSIFKFDKHYCCF